MGAGDRHGIKVFFFVPVYPRLLTLVVDNGALPFLQLIRLGGGHKKRLNCPEAAFPGQQVLGPASVSFERSSFRMYRCCLNRYYNRFQGHNGLIILHAISEPFIGLGGEMSTKALENLHQ